jgi:hypothetical protein
MLMMSRFRRDQDGGVLVETTVMMSILFVFLLGSVDFLFAFYQWNAASKAVQLGARIAAVSDPVAQNLGSLSTNVSGNPQDPMPSFSVTCDGHAASCTCTGTCTGVGNYNATAMNRIVYGRGNSGSCNAPTRVYFAGMCNMFSGLTPDNVKIIYASPANSNGGQGIVGEPDGRPVPLVQVSLQRLNFRYNFLPFGQKQIGPAATSPTTLGGEALSSSAQCLSGAC